MDHTNPKMRVTGSRTGMWDWSGQLKSSGDFAAKSKKEDFTCSSRISRCKKDLCGAVEGYFTHYMDTGYLPQERTKYKTQTETTEAEKKKA